MSLTEYLTQRTAFPAWPMADLTAALRLIAGERLKAQQLLDAAHAEQTDEPDDRKRQALEGPIQAGGAAVRELDRAALALRKGMQAIQSLDAADARVTQLANEP